MLAEHVEDRLAWGGDLQFTLAKLVRQVGQRLLDESVRVLVLRTGPAHEAFWWARCSRPPIRETTNNPTKVRVMQGPLGRLSG